MISASVRTMSSVLSTASHHRSNIQSMAAAACQLTNMKMSLDTHMGLTAFQATRMTHHSMSIMSLVNTVVPRVKSSTRMLVRAVPDTSARSAASHQHHSSIHSSSVNALLKQLTTLSSIMALATTVSQVQILTSRSIAVRSHLVYANPRLGLSGGEALVN